MPKTAWLHEDPVKEHYWGLERNHIDLTRDEDGNWFDSEGVRFSTFDMSRVPILLIRYIPVCPECKDKCMIGFFNWEKDQEGNGGFAFRHTYHFWYEGKEMWGYPPPVRPSANQPGVQAVDVAISTATIPPGGTATVNADRTVNTFITDNEERKAFHEGREAFKSGLSKWKNPYDGRQVVGRAWNAGWSTAQQETPSAD